MGGQREPPVRRVLTTIAITAFWLFMNGLLVYREVWPTLADRSGGGYHRFLEEIDRPVVETFAVWQGGRRIGKVRLERRRTDKGAYEIEGKLSLDSPVLIYAKPSPMRVEVLMTLDRGMSLERVDVLLDAIVFARLAGTVEDGAIVFRSVEGKNFGPFRVPYDGKEAFQHALMPMMGRKDLAVGMRWRVKLMPLLPFASAQHATLDVKALEPVEVNGRTVDAFRVETRIGETSPTAYNAWVSQEGVLLKQELPYGLALTREEPSRD